MTQNAGSQEPESEGRRARTEEERESIWTIPAKYKGWYFGLFSIQIIIAAIWLAITAIADESRNGVWEVLLFVWQGMAPIAITSATFALVIIDAWKTTMVFGTWLEETLEKRRRRQIKEAVDRAVEKTRSEEREATHEAVDRAVEKTRTEERQRWLEWNQRRETAVAAGQEFNEPPPGVDPGNEDGQPK